MDRNPLIQSLSSSLNLGTSRFFLTSVVRNSEHEPKGRRWSYKGKVLVVFILKNSARLLCVYRSLFSLPSRRNLQSLSTLRWASLAMCSFLTCDSSTVTDISSNMRQ